MVAFVEQGVVRNPSEDARLIHQGLMIVVDAVGDLKEIVQAAHEHMTRPVVLTPEQVKEIAAEVVKLIQESAADL